VLPESTRGRIVGRYVVFGEIASGGMASVHLGRLLGSVGFSRIVAIKQLHPHFAKDAEFVAMFVDEARLAARIKHPNVVPTLDVVSSDGELFLVMEYVVGESLFRLLRPTHGRGQALPPPVASAIVAGALHGLHAAHEARNERGERLDVVHRDVSPQNILVGVDGVPRVFDFGVAKAVGRIQTTHDGQTKGKLAYMSPEQARGLPVDRTTDVYAAAVVLWEALTGTRLFAADDPQSLISQVLTKSPPAPSAVLRSIPRAVDDVVLRGLARDRSRRFATALQMADALEKAVDPVSARDLGRWVEAAAGERLKARADLVERIERGEESQSSGVRHHVGSPSIVETGEAAPLDRTDLEMSALEASQASLGSVSSSGARHPPGTRRRWWSFVAMGVLGTAALSVQWIRHEHTGDRSHPAVDPSPSESSSHDLANGSTVTSSSAQGSAGSVVPSPPAPTSAAEPLAPPLPNERPPLASSASPGALPKGAPSRKNHPVPRPHTPSCDNPFTVDANGIRHPIPECLHLAPSQ
jgi:eukaryotic-like serine/threonine-protein kinase